MKKKLLPLAMLAGLNPEPILFGSASLNREPLIYPVKWLEAGTGTEVLDFNLYLSPYDHWAEAAPAKRCQSLGYRRLGPLNKY